ncbi:6-phosphofructokinase [Vallitalea okinawensis]|uniref:6-phosphofructokinase n=1 Tax=Vallitalea okinawensis TaxID=2078660 RepID=UPI000CFDDAE8|nr:6-phosphofructokinase [Vallitalea okinawensis]
MSKEIKTIGVLTSGGDAPGMNATIRAVVRAALNKGLRVMGIRRGYEGLINGDIFEMGPKNVSDIIHRGGTILYSARCPEFKKLEVQKRGAEMCKVFGIEGLVVIGGDGSFQGAQKLANLGINTIGIPGTIDLDIACTDYTIGFDTAVNVAVDALNKLRDTSSSHERCSVVEVMGRDSGHIAVWCGLASGADVVLIPEKKDDYSKEKVIRRIIDNRHQGKSHNIVIVAEGVGGSQDLAKEIENVTGIETRATILGHIQRGGTPTALEIKHASAMGVKAVELLIDGKSNRVVAYKNNEYVDFDINEGLAMDKSVDMSLYEINKVVSRY